MKTVAVLLLLFMLLTVVYGAGKQPENKKGRCPQLIDFIMGKECTDRCTSDSQCPGTEKCCQSDGGPNCQQCMEPQEETPETMCRIGCPRIYLPVCGSDGISYGNNCTLDFITCTRNQGFIHLVHEGNCKPEKEIELPAPSKCQEQGVDSTCKEKRDQVRKSGLIGAYVPQCDDQGFYQPKQCHASTGYCWCADCSGKELTKRARPHLTLGDECEQLRNN